jgi:hypothetical protein
MDSQKKVRLVQEIARICDELGWIIGIPTGEGAVHGLIIGTEDFIRQTAVINEDERYDVFSNKITNMVTQEDDVPKKPTGDGGQNGPTFH